MNSIRDRISIYDGSCGALSTRISHPQKSNENEIIGDIFWNNWLLYDSTLIFLQLDFLNQKFGCKRYIFP